MGGYITDTETIIWFLEVIIKRRLPVQCPPVASHNPEENPQQLKGSIRISVLSSAAPLWAHLCIVPSGLTRQAPLP